MSVINRKVFRPTPTFSLRLAILPTAVLFRNVKCTLLDLVTLFISKSTQEKSRFINTTCQDRLVLKRKSKWVGTRHSWYNAFTWADKWWCQVTCMASCLNRETIISKVFPTTIQISGVWYRRNEAPSPVVVDQWRTACIMNEISHGHIHQWRIVSTVHRSRVDPRKEGESCGNARFRERK
jgi:hypothetical protein